LIIYQELRAKVCPRCAGGWSICVRVGKVWCGAEALGQQGPALAGALFGAGWWFFLDSIAYSRAVVGADVSGTAWVPGCVATLAFLLMC
jgi:hypothetical protein